MGLIKKIWREVLLILLLGESGYLIYYWGVSRPENRTVQGLVLIAIAAGIVGSVFLIKSLWRDKWKSKTVEKMQKLFGKVQNFFEKFVDKLGIKRKKKSVLSGKTRIIYDRTSPMEKEQAKQSAKPPKWKQLQSDRARMRYLYRQMINEKIKRGELIYSTETPAEISQKKENSATEDELFSMYISYRYDERIAPPEKEVVDLKKSLEIK